MACNCSLVQNSINPQQISKQSWRRTMVVPMMLVYQCTVSVIIPRYTVFGRILVTLTLALNKTKARNTRPRPKASRPMPEVSRSRPENFLASRPRPNNPGYHASHHPSDASTPECPSNVIKMFCLCLGEVCLMIDTFEPCDLEF